MAQKTSRREEGKIPIQGEKRYTCSYGDSWGGAQRIELGKSECSRGRGSNKEKKREIALSRRGARKELEGKGDMPRNTRGKKRERRVKNGISQILNAEKGLLRAKVGGPDEKIQICWGIRR